MPIHPAILEKRAELAELCRRYRVKTLEVFGSAATEAFDPERSDVDLLVELDGREALFQRFFGLQADLETALGRKIDLISPSAIENKYLMISINRTRTLVHAA